MLGGYNFGPETAPGAGVTLALKNGTWGDRIGWREVEFGSPESRNSCEQFWKIHRLIRYDLSTL